jgi:hypothetical protein
MYRTGLTVVSNNAGNGDDGLRVEVELSGEPGAALPIRNGGHPSVST